jgi:cation:H+ antiporter
MLLTDFIIVLLSAIAVLVTAHVSLKKALWLVERFGFSEAIVGMTVLSIGTSLPEIITHIMGSLQILRDPESFRQVSGLVIGTNIGSDIFQQNVVLSLTGLVGLLAVHRDRLLSDVGGLVLAAVVLLVMSIDGIVTRAEGSVLFGGYIIYLIWLNKRDHANHVVEGHGKSLLRAALILLACFVVMALAAETLLQRSLSIVSQLPISASFFGVVLLGVAAAFPELTTALLALIKRKEAISAGVLIGSNITNPTLALGIGAMLSEYAVPAVVVSFDLPVKIATALLILRFLWDKRMAKGEAVLLIGLYFTYIACRQAFWPMDQ